VAILKAHPTLKSLCGNKGNETQLDMSGKMYGAGDAIMLATEVVDNGALLVLSLQSNRLCAAGGKALAGGLKDNQVITELNISSNCLGYKALNSSDGTDMSGVIALANVISGMEAMTSINLANNNIGTIVMSDGWKYDGDTNEYWKEVDGAEQVSKYVPGGCGSLGVIAVANAIKDMRALSSLNLAVNSIGGYYIGGSQNRKFHPTPGGKDTLLPSWSAPLILLLLLQGLMPLLMPSRIWGR
jgi:hypothetical protein